MVNKWNNYEIEFLKKYYSINGEQHYKPINWFGGISVFDKLIKRDKIKEKYCVDNKIKLVIIPYNMDINLIINNSLL